MKVLAACVAAVAAVGCGGVSKQELDSVKAELIANDEKSATQLKRELMGTEAKFVQMQQLGMKIEKQLEDMDKLRKDLLEVSKRLEAHSATASNQVLKALQFEERMMAQRLADLRALIEELQKK